MGGHREQPARTGSRSYRFKLAPTRAQVDDLDALLRVQRALYNAALEQRREAWRAGRHSVTRVDQFKELTQVLPAEPELARFGLQPARGTLWRLDHGFQAFFRRVKRGGVPGFPRFQGRDRFDSVGYPEPDGWKLVPCVGKRDGRLRLQGVGQLRVRLHRELEGEPRTLTIRRRGKNWWATIQCRNVPVEALPATGREVGIDRGVTVLAATSDDELIENPRHLAAAAERLAEAQQAVSRCQTGSKRRLRARVRRLHERVAEQCRDSNHELSRRLIVRYDRIVLEDLKIGNMTRSASGTVEKPGTNVAAKSGLNRVILDAGWGQLASFISYKAADAGRSLEFVQPHHTSTTCSECGHKDEASRVTRERFLCTSCGVDLHADINAARNILDRAGPARPLLIAA